MLTVALPDELIKDVGITNLTPEEEYWNRERKYSINGVDVRKFSNSKKGGMEPQDDPYYGRKPVSSWYTPILCGRSNTDIFIQKRRSKM